VPSNDRSLFKLFFTLTPMHIAYREGGEASSANKPATDKGNTQRV